LQIQHDRTIPLVERGRRPLRVVVIGGASWNTMIQLERFPEPRASTVWPVDWYDAVGSSGAGKALNLARLGVAVTLHAALGDDEEGRRVAAFLEAAGVHLIETRDHAGTARHLNLMDPDGRRISFLLQRGPTPHVDVTMLEPAIATADAVCIEIVDHARHFIPLLRRHGHPIWTDLHDYDGASTYHEDFIEAADVVLLSGDRLPDPRPVMEGLRRRGKRLVVCTLAERGALALTADGEWRVVAAETAEIVDTNGAGDAFATGLLVAQLLEFPLRDGLAIAARAAALAIGSRDLASPELSLERVVRPRWRQ
jgi:sugar/nucleoside kinase (ribokinase family)